MNDWAGVSSLTAWGLGKTFEALAIIKYYELRNDRVLVLVPKRLRDNWTLYKANDLRNSLASDRFNYDVLNHTDPFPAMAGYLAISTLPTSIGAITTLWSSMNPIIFATKQHTATGRHVMTV